jgi:hypothetical protein
MDMRTTLSTLILTVLLTAPVSAYSDRDYCRDTKRAERLDCQGKYIADVADCGWWYAAERWIGVEYASENFADCRLDADAEREACRAEAEVDCNAWAGQP